VDPVLERGEALERHAAPVALVGEGGVGEAVAEDVVAARQRGLDAAQDVVAARREDDQRLRDRVHAGAEQRRAQRLGERRSARLAGRDDAAAGRAQALRERLEVRRLAGAVDPLEGDEAAPPRHGRRVQDGARSLRW
jgi:hypothetical protein